MSRQALAKAFTLEIANDSNRGQSTQQSDDLLTPEQAIRPPLNLNYLAALTAISRTRRSCIAAISLNTVGLGFEVRTRKGHEEEVTSDLEHADVEQHFDELARADRRLGRPSFTRLLSAVKWDQYEVGNGYLEVSRNSLDGTVDGLYHVPGRLLRRRGDRDGWIMGPRKAAAGDLTYFYEYGDKVQYDDAGMPTSTLRQGRRWAVNEIIAFQLYTSASRDYGLPPDYQLANDYLGDKLAGQSNVGYFEHSGVPPTVIFVQGREAKGEKDDGVEIVVDQTFTQAIIDTLKLKGGQGRVAVVPVPPGTKTEAHDLAVLSERDLGHVQFRSDNRRATLGAYRISPVFVADIEDAGKYTAEVERALTKEQVFDPEQRDTADVLQQTLLHEISPHFEFVFTGLAIKGDEAKRESANDLADRGKIQNGEYRAAHGYPPLIEAENPDPAKGEVEVGWNSQLVSPRTPMTVLGGTPSSDPFAKSIAGGLAGDVEAEFERSLDEGIAAVQRMSDAEIRPVIVKSVDNGFVVEPYLNGSG